MNCCRIKVVFMFFLLMAAVARVAAAGSAMDEVESFGAEPKVETAAATQTLRVCMVFYKGVDPKRLENVPPGISERLFGVPVMVLKDTPEVPPEAYVDVRKKYYAGKILDQLEKLKPPGCVVIIGYVNELIFIGRYPVVNGVGNPKQDAAVISAVRLDVDDRGLYEQRVLGESLHELGHVFGFDHCPLDSCVMKKASDFDDLDFRGRSFCRFHLQKAYDYLKGRGLELPPLKFEQAEAKPPAPVAPQTQAVPSNPADDSEPPEVVSVSIADGSVVSRDIGSVIAGIRDTGGSGVDPLSVKVFLDGNPLDVQFHERRVELAAWAGTVEPGTHTLQIHASDYAGNAMAPYNVVFTAE